MKPIINIITGNTYESMRLAGQICKISVREIKKSLDSERAYRASNGKLYMFRETNYRKTTIAKPRPVTFPFGKYKGWKVTSVKDLSYLGWFYKLDNIEGRLKRAIELRIKQLNK
jgi:uncharacterized protein (DUF3820 family)